MKLPRYVLAGCAATALLGAATGIAYAQPKPEVTLAIADPYFVAATGGDTVLIAHVKNADECLLSVTGPANIVTHIPTTKNCTKGLYTGEIWLKPNPGTKMRYVEIEVHAIAGNASAHGPFWVAQYGGTKPAAVTASVTPTTFPAALPVVPAPSPVVDVVVVPTTSVPTTSTSIPATTTTTFAAPATTTTVYVTPTTAPTTTVPPATTTTVTTPPCPPTTWRYVSHGPGCIPAALKDGSCVN